MELCHTMKSDLDVKSLLRYLPIEMLDRNINV